VVTIFGGAPWWVYVALFALVMVIAIARWHVKKYSVVGGLLLVRSGLVNRSIRVVPIASTSTPTAIGQCPAGGHTWMIADAVPEVAQARRLGAGVFDIGGDV
jgi:hypothetical protein